MRDIKLNAKSQKSVIHCGAGAFEKYSKSDKQQFVVTDSNVYALYEDLIKGFNAPVKIIKAGERSKNWNVLRDILSAMAEAGLRRNGRVIAFGGGVVGDIAGLAASLYMRGVEIMQIPTTLLAQVDSSVGGKTAVDFKSVKNLVGAFYQPQEVIVDPLFLKTLKRKELICGLGEIIKYGALDKEIFKKLKENSDRLLDLKFLESITADCIRHKKEAVESDERDEGGRRKTLNLGHTTGHALELYYGGKSHGEYVLYGTFFETYIYEKLYGKSEYLNELKELILSVVKIPHFENIAGAACLAKFDKKNGEEKKVTLISPATLGASAEISLEFETYVSLLEECNGEIER